MENDTVPSIREPSSHQGSITANAGDRRDMGLITGLGRSPGGGNSNPLQYSCLENPKERGAWWATVHGVTKSWTRPKRLSTHALRHLYDNRDMCLEEKTSRMLRQQIIRNFIQGGCVMENLKAEMKFKLRATDEQGLAEDECERPGKSVFAPRGWDCKGEM